MTHDTTKSSPKINQPFIIGSLVRFAMPDDRIEFPEHQGETGIVQHYFPRNSETDYGIVGAFMLKTKQYFWHYGEYWTAIL